MKAKKYTIEDPIYNVSVDFWIGGTLRDLQKKYDPEKEFDHVYANNVNGKFFHISYKNGDEQYVIWIENKNTELAVHEIVHLVNAVFAARGVQLDRENDEPMAYYISYWVREFFKYL